MWKYKLNEVCDIACDLYIIKASFKSNIAIVWVNIWDSQNSMKAKLLINKSFNIGYHIATIKETNINSGISQCRNWWKWDHSIFVCYIYGFKYQKCNNPQKLEHYREMAWYCKINFKTNFPRLETKKEKPYTHLFKCINCKDEH